MYDWDVLRSNLYAAINDTGHSLCILQVDVLENTVKQLGTSLKQMRCQLNKRSGGISMNNVVECYYVGSQF